MVEKRNGKWFNWAGDVGFSPKSVERPTSDEDVQRIVRHARDQGRTVRAIGSGHSSNALMACDDVLVSTEKLAGIEAIDTARGEVSVRAGMKLREINNALFEHGLMLENLGDVDIQGLAGAVSTGTHGSGTRFTNLSGFVRGGRLVSGTGEIMEFSAESTPELLQAARVALGALGIFTSLTIRVVPAVWLKRKEWCTHIDQCLTHVEQLNAQHRNFDFYWYPRCDLAKLRTWDPPGDEPGSLPFARLDKEMEGWTKDVMGTEQVLHYHESEYSVPAAAVLACFHAIRKRVKQHHRKHVAWRILVRGIGADDGFLSNAYDRDIFAITLHQNNTLPCWDYFKDIEAIYRDHDGRPHWGKKHTLSCEQLQPLYPRWDDFQRVRRGLDPDGTFLSGYLRTLLEPGNTRKSKAS